MKGLFIPDITTEMFRSGFFESVEALIAEGKTYDIDYEPERKMKGNWIHNPDPMVWRGCWSLLAMLCIDDVYDCTDYCPNCGADMRGEEETKVAEECEIGGRNEQ